MANLSATGLTIRSQADILAQVEADQRAQISNSLDQSTSSPLGQFNRIGARALRILEEALASVWLAIDPDSAAGVALDRISALTGTYRRPATLSSVLVSISVEAGTYAAGTLIAHPAGRPDDRFANVESITVASTSTVGVLFRALEPGPVQAASSSLVIAGPVSGWLSIVSHPDATVGRATETEVELRIRREREVTNPGSASVGGVSAAVSRLAGEGVTPVESVTVIENASEATVDSIPPHSIEVIAFGPQSPSSADDEAVARRILAAKSAGIGTFGNTPVDLLDSEGQPIQIQFTRPTVEDLTVVINVAVREGVFQGDQDVVDVVATRAQETFVPGLDAAGSQIAAWVHEIPGVLRVTSITINGGASFAVFAIGTRQIARIDSSAITVNSTEATP